LSTAAGRCGASHREAVLGPHHLNQRLDASSVDYLLLGGKATVVLVAERLPNQDALTKQGARLCMVWGLVTETDCSDGRCSCLAATG
jgi:hypothetical protein